MMNVGQTQELLHALRDRHCSRRKRSAEHRHTCLDAVQSSPSMHSGLRDATGNVTVSRRTALNGAQIAAFVCLSLCPTSYSSSIASCLDARPRWQQQSGSRMPSRTLVMRIRGGKSPAAVSEPNFTCDDQYNLNKYAGYNLRRKELKAELQELIETLEGLRDGLDEVTLMDRDAADFKLKWASAYSDWDPDMVMTMLEGKIELHESDIEDYKTDIREIEEKMAELGGTLKEKFGDQVHLDGESEEENGP